LHNKNALLRRQLTMTLNLAWQGMLNLKLMPEADLMGCTAPCRSF